MVNIFYGEAGTGKSYELLKLIKKDIQAGRKVISLIPEQHSFLYEEKVYNMLGAKDFHKTSCHSFSSLSRAIFKKYGQGSISREYADDISKTIILYSSIKNQRGRLGYFKKKSSNPDFINEMGKLISNLRKSKINPPDIYEKTEEFDPVLKDKASDVYYIYNEYLNNMEKIGKKDMTTEITESSVIAEKNRYFNNMTVIVDEFEGFSEDQYDMLETIICSCSDFYISLRSDDISDTDSSIFMSDNSTYRKIYDIAKKYGFDVRVRKFESGVRYKNKSIEYMSRNIFKNSSKKISSSGVRIFEADDIYGEAEYVAASIKRLVSENNYSYRDIAVLSNNLPDYSMHIESAFKRYDIPYNISLKKNISYMPLMQYLTSLFSIASKKTPDTESVLRYAKTGLCGVESYDLSELENYVYIWNIEGELWLSDFQADSKKQNLDKINETRKKIIGPIEDFREKCSGNHKIRDYCKNLIEFMSEQEIDSKLQDMFFYDSKVCASMEFVWNKFISIIDDIVQIMADEKISFSEFSDLFMMLSDQLSFDMPPVMLDSVEIAEAQSARLENIKAVFVMGANDGIFPSITEESCIFTDSEKKMLSDLDINIYKDMQQLSADSKLIAYKAISASSEYICLSYSLSGSDGQKRYPSDIIDQINDMFENYDDIFEIQKRIPLEYYCLTKKSAYYHYVLSGTDKGKYGVLKDVLIQDPEYAANIKYLDDFIDDVNYTVYNKELLKKNIGENLKTSPSGIEDYNRCPFVYFCKRIMKIYKPMVKEINPLERGNVIHFILEKIIDKYSREEFIHLSEQEIENDAGKFGEIFLKEQFSDGITLSPRMKILYKKVISDVKNAVCHLQNEFLQSEYYPDRTELVIDTGQPAKPLSLKLENGCHIYISGKIDRVDVAELPDKNKAVRVVDYKSGTKKFSIQNIYNGLDHQMLLYLFTITDEKNLYSGYIPAGVLYMPSGAVSNTERTGFSGQVEEYLNNYYSMNGILLNNMAVIRSMEKDIAGVYIPARLDKTGESIDDVWSSVISEKNMEILKKFIYRKIKLAGDAIYSGNFQCRPVFEKKLKCDNCDYCFVCGNSDGRNIVEIETMGRKNKNEKAEEIFALMEKELEEGAVEYGVD